MGPPKDDPELIEQKAIWTTLMHPHLMYASASRSLQEAPEILSRVKRARGYFPVVGIGFFDSLAQPSTDRKPAKSRGKGKKKGKTFSYKGEKSPNLAKNTDLTLRKTPTSRRTSSTDIQEASDRHWHNSWWTNITLLGFAHQNVPTKERPLHFHMVNVHLVPYL